MPFVNACSRFLYLENLGADEAVAAAGMGARAEKAEKVDKTAKPRQSAGRGRTKKAGNGAAVPDSPVDVPLELDEAADVQPIRLDTTALKRDARLVALLRNAVESAAGEDGWSPLGSVGQQIGNQASFDPRNYGYRKLIDLIEATQLFELDRRGSQFLLRDKRQARPARG
jgi:uncharacterized LabA/DUF88 family protein